MEKQKQILARNNTTGVIFPINEETYKIQHYNWTRVTKEEALANTPAPVESTEPAEKGIGYSTTEPDVHMTASGEPFKTEVTAKAAMKKKSLSEDEWITTEVPDGFVITRK